LIEVDILNINRLSKNYGKSKVIDNIDLNVPEGSIFGFIGQNGAGKTTTMKMILGLLKSDTGEIKVCGETVSYGRTNTNRNVGYLPDVPEFYNYMKPIEYLALCGEIAKLSKSETRSRSNELLSLVGLDGVKRRIGGFSRGMKQRLGIAQALLSRPRLLICDEPTSALDPMGRKDILDILRRIKGSTTVLFSTHILSDVERICDRVAILHNGTIVINGTLSEIKALHKSNELLVEFSSVEEIKKFKSCGDIEPLLANSEDIGMEIILQDANMKFLQSTVITTLAQTGLYPVRMEVIEPSLENLFLEVAQ
jgi:ABC-2 type transport system ATP-binding protein